MEAIGGLGTLCLMLIVPAIWNLQGEVSATSANIVAASSNIENNTKRIEKIDDVYAALLKSTATIHAIDKRISLIEAAGILPLADKRLETLEASTIALQESITNINATLSNVAPSDVKKRVEDAIAATEALHKKIDALQSSFPENKPASPLPSL